MESGKPAQIAAINDPFIDLEYMVYLLKYDSVHGRFRGDVRAESDSLVVNGEKIKVFGAKDPAEIPWADAGTDYVMECSGAFLKQEAC
jgi:glyceraldehyde 3-phosphate dehydrogenase